MIRWGSATRQPHAHRAEPTPRWWELVLDVAAFVGVAALWAIVILLAGLDNVR